MKVRVLFLCILFSIPLNSFASDFRLLTFADYYGRIESDETYQNLRNRYYIQPELRTSLFNNIIDLELSANLWYQPIGSKEFIAPENILREAYITAPMGSFDITLGQKFVTFGFADAFSPLNVLNGSNTTILSLDDNTDGKRPDLMLQIQYYPNFDDSIELIYEPFPRPDYKPPQEIEGTGTNSSVTTQFDNPAYLTDSSHSIFARYYHIAPSFDMQLVYAWYIDKTPAFDLTVLNDNGSSLTGTINTYYNRSQLFGGAFSTTLGEIVLSEDMAFTLTGDLEGKDPGTKNSSFASNTQLTGSILHGTFAQLNIIYQHFLNYDSLDAQYTTSSFSRLIDEINDFHIQPQQNIAFFIGHLHRSFLREKLYTALNIGFFFSTDVYLAPRISYNLTDRFKLETGADIRTGEPSDNDLVRTADEDNFFVRLKYEY